MQMSVLLHLITVQTHEYMHAHTYMYTNPLTFHLRGCIFKIWLPFSISFPDTTET